MTKEELRSLYRKKRMMLSRSERALAERNVCKRFFERIDVSNARLVHHYLSRDDEFDPSEIVEGVRSRVPSVQFAVPRVYKDSLEHLVITPMTKMATNQFGIEEPLAGKSVTPGSIDIVLVPLLCFDVDNQRVGYGGGYYDRFLADCRPDCVKVGLSYFPPIPRIEDLHEGDVALDLCISPN